MRLRHPVLTLITVMASVLVGIAGTGWWWLKSTRHLDAIIAEAESRGYKRSQAKVSSHPLWPTIERLSRALGATRLKIKHGEPVDPSQLIALTTPEERASTRAVIDEVIALPDEADPLMGAAVLIGDRLADRVFVAEHGDLQLSVRAAARAIGHNTLQGNLKKLNRALRYRLDDCRSAGVEAGFLRIRIHLALQMVLEDDHLVGLIQWVKRRAERSDSRLGWSTRLRSRFAETHFAAECFAWADFVDTKPTAATMSARIRDSYAVDRSDGFWWDGRNNARARFESAVSDTYEMLVAILEGLTLCALIDDSEPPVDWFDPALAPLRTKPAADGHMGLIYSVGWNGTDDGGTFPSDAILMGAP